MHRKETFVPMLGSSCYRYREVIVTLNEPVLGENHTLVYSWVMNLPGGAKEQGRSYFFYFPRGPYDDTEVRDKVAEALFRMHEREMKRECTPPWKHPQKPILFERIRSGDIL